MVGIRRAIAQFILSFYTLQFLVSAYLGDDRFAMCFGALAACYGLAFFGLAAEWFWARWFATGLGNFGALALAVVLKVGPEPVFLFFGLTHLLIMLCLLGEGMAAKYEHSEATAERYGFPQETLAMLRRAVKSAGSALPPLILIALGPKEEGAWVPWLLLGGGIASVYGLLRLRTWGIFAAGATGLVAIAEAFGSFGTASKASFIAYVEHGTPLGVVLGDLSGSQLVISSGFGLLAGIALLMVPLAFVGPLWQRLRS